MDIGRTSKEILTSGSNELQYLKEVKMKHYVIKSEKGYLTGLWLNVGMDSEKYTEWAESIDDAQQYDAATVGSIIEDSQRCEGPYLRMRPIEVKLVEVGG